MTCRRSEAEQERLAAALRANLARRKAQSRQRQDGRAPERHEAPSGPPEGTAEPGATGGAGEE
jgi:hypothetical protein